MMDLRQEGRGLLGKKPLPPVRIWNVAIKSLSNIYYFGFYFG
jgi:hypothetical protein